MNKTKIRARVLQYLNRHKNRAYKQKQIFKTLKFEPSLYDRFKETLREMAKKGEIERKGKHSYGIYDQSDLYTGTIHIKSRGFGIVTTESGDEFFIGNYDMGSALDGDVVKVALYKKQFGPRREGRVVDIVQRVRKTILGIVEETFGGFYCHPLKTSGIKRIFVSKEDAGPVKSGDLAVVEITTYPTKKSECVGRIGKVIGDPEDPANDFATILVLNNISPGFPKPVMREAEEIPQKVEDSSENRLDLRGLEVFTIDPIDAKDFDDAVSIQPGKNGGWRVGVHISDVSHYVREGSKLDREAQKRGTSIYLINHVIPMLPEILSTEICSLRQDEDRLTQSVFLHISTSGKVIGYEFADTIIRNKRRFNYEEVQSILEGRKKSSYREVLQEMNHVAKLLLKNRKELGSIDFDLPEPVFEMGGDEIPSVIRRRERLDSHRLIEEFMLAANRSVAEYIGSRRAKEKLPFIYRIHEQPEESDIRDFLLLLKHLGIQYNIKGEATPSDFRKILEIVAKYPFRDFIEKVALRTMTKAIYSSKRGGHFGLAFSLYTHFTSPIRRYPDLVVHRLLRRYRKKDYQENDLKFLRRSLPRRTRHMSEMEQRAEEAEREFILLKQMRYLKQRTGETFHGIISGVTDFGIFIELEDSMIEGLIHVSKLKDDFYEFIPELYTLKGRRSGKIYRLGDKHKVKVENVDIPKRRADFSFV